MLLFFNHLIVNKTFFSINPFFLFLHGFLVFKLNSLKNTIKGYLRNPEEENRATGLESYLSRRAGYGTRSDYLMGVIRLVKVLHAWDY